MRSFSLFIFTSLQTCINALSCVYHVVKILWNQVIGLILPPTCVACTALLPKNEPIGFCPTCWKKLPHWNKEKTPVPRLPKYINSFSAPFLYETMAREQILALKFADATELAPVFAPFLALHMPKNISASELLIVPVPLHKKRIRSRLYNQSSLLARALQKITVSPFGSLSSLRKALFSPPQSQKTARERRKLPLNTFVSSKNSVFGRKILLIDDIFTTGSTLNACACALKKAGAIEVHALCIAYTPPS